MDYLTPQKIKDELHKSLSILCKFDKCALLDYPAHLNIGDQLIWLGDIFYITDVLKAKILYSSNFSDFSSRKMEEKIGDSPIFFHGGGNLGDLYPKHQIFRKRVISRYKHRPIIILPQTIYFRDKRHLKKDAKLFNSHPDLTLFVRENKSYEIASEVFYNCRILKAPDMAFQLAGIPKLEVKLKQKTSILYLCRNDKEMNINFHFPAESPNIVVEDWVSYKWIKKNPIPIRGAARLIREIWQRRLAYPHEYISRIKWNHFHPYAKIIKALCNSSRHLNSWSLMHSGIYQLKKYRLVITNRLHGHILCVILGIPNILLANSYYKNESFYNTWTCQIPFCRFVPQPQKVKSVISELI